MAEQMNETTSRGSRVQRLRQWVRYMRWNARYEASRKVDMWALSIAHRLPRKIAMWAFVRVVNEGCEGNPLQQSLKEIMDRWERAGRTPEPSEQPTEGA